MNSIRNNHLEEFKQVVEEFYAYSHMYPNVNHIMNEMVLLACSWERCEFVKVISELPMFVHEPDCCDLMMSLAQKVNRSHSHSLRNREQVFRTFLLGWDFMQKKNIQWNKNQVLVNACSQGDYVFVELLCAKCTHAEIIENNNEALRQACENGQYICAKLIAQKVNIVD